MKKLLSLLFLFTLGTILAQPTVVDYNYWGLKGSTIGNNISFVGTKNARSLFLRSNSASEDGYLKYDSIGDLTFKIENTDPASPNTFAIKKWPTLTTYAGIWFGTNSFRGDNYFLISDTNQNILNAKKSLLFNTGHRRFMSATSTFTSAGSIITLDAITNTIAVANAELRHFTIAGSVTTWTPGTTALNRDFLFSAQTHSALTTAVITNDVGMEVNAPTAGTGMTQTNAWAISCKGNQNITTQLSIGSSLLAPLARLHLAAGNSTMSAFRLTSQTAPSSPTAGEYWYNTTTGHTFQGNLTTSGTNTLTGNTRIGATTAPINALSVTGAIDASTTFSCGTTATLAGKSYLGASGTAPTAKLHIAAGTTGATTAPIKLTSGSLMTSAEAGAVEFLTDDYYVTITTGTARQKLGRVLTGSATLDFGSTLAGTVTDLTVAVTGAVSGDVVSIGVPNGSMPATGTFQGWVSANDVVTVRYANNSLTLTQDPASGTFKVTVNKN